MPSTFYLTPAFPIAHCITQSHSDIKPVHQTLEFVVTILEKLNANIRL